jgi:hypothetical protein
MNKNNKADPLTASKNAPYESPVITRVRMEDRQVVAMAVCKEDLNNPGCAQLLQPTFNINPS